MSDTATTEARLRALEAGMAELREAVAATHQTAQLLLLRSQGSDEDEAPTNTLRDTAWLCERCGARLGVYNADADELRIRYKDHSVYVIPGIGGSTRVPCRRCAAVNELRDTRSAAQVAAAVAAAEAAE